MADVRLSQRRRGRSPSKSLAASNFTTSTAQLGCLGQPWETRMGPAHNHHDHVDAGHGRALAIGVALNIVYVAIEAGYGLAIGSLALLSDAGHNLSDVVGLLLAWGGLALARVTPTHRRTYGWRGATILASLLNAMLLLVAVGGIGWEAVRRFSTPTEIGGMQIVVVASIGVVINTVTALLLMSGRKGDLNMRGAFLHMAADAGVSVGVVIAGLAIYFTGRTWIDPAVSLVVAAAIFLSTWGLLKESINMAMQATPEGIDPTEVEDYFASLSGITAVHDLHVWAIGTTEFALSVHLIKPRVEDEDALLREMSRDVHQRFNIQHATFQIERGSGPACQQSLPGSL